MLMKMKILLWHTIRYTKYYGRQRAEKFAELFELDFDKFFFFLDKFRNAFYTNSQIFLHVEI